MQGAITCIEQDATRNALAVSVERPLQPPTTNCRSGISNPHICIDAIPHPSLWDDVWLERIKALTPKDLTIIHRQHTRRCAEILAQVRGCMGPGTAACAAEVRIHAWVSCLGLMHRSLIRRMGHMHGSGNPMHARDRCMPMRETSSSSLPRAGREHAHARGRSLHEANNISTREACAHARDKQCLLFCLSAVTPCMWRVGLRHMLACST